jgi:hypothetical protein
MPRPPGLLKRHRAFASAFRIFYSGLAPTNQSVDVVPQTPAILRMASRIGSRSRNVGTRAMSVELEAER